MSPGSSQHQTDVTERLTSRGSMQYASNRKKSPNSLSARFLARAGVLTSLGVALSATSANAQSIGYQSGSYAGYGGSTCGSIGWLPPGPLMPSLGGVYLGAY